MVSVKCIIYNKMSFKIVLQCLKLLISQMFPAWPQRVSLPSLVRAVRKEPSARAAAANKLTVAICKLCSRNIVSANQRRQI